MKIEIIVVFILFLSLPGYGQGDSTTWKTDIEMGFRTYFMGTSYWGEYKNDHALGQMARILVETQLPRGFQIKGEYLAFLRVLSSDLTVLDKRVPTLNRYEVGLFDVNHLDRNLFGKIGNLHLTYQNKNFQAKLGRMEINTPFINAQDGRLSPTYVEGLKIRFQVDPKVTLNSHLIWGISPRSTGQWFSLGESVGMYPVGRDEYGNPSAYFGHTQVDFIHILDIGFTLDSQSSLQINHTYVQNVYNSYLAQWDKTWKTPKSHMQGITGIQATVQHGIGNGGNDEAGLRYKNPEDFHFILSGRIGLKSKNILWHLNYTKMRGNGRYLSPREWGKDPFYTFIPRERNEGLQEVDAISSYFQHTNTQKPLQLYTFLGLYFLPDPSNLKRNKYAFPSYAQVNLGARYNADVLAKGLNLHLILMSKTALKQENIRPAWVYNKVNLFHLNLILDYTIPWK